MRLTLGATVEVQASFPGNLKGGPGKAVYPLREDAPCLKTYTRDHGEEVPLLHLLKGRPDQW